MEIGYSKYWDDHFSFKKKKKLQNFIFNERLNVIKYINN